jgi:ubiquinone/menaquinone biosynthesis C-methylase UbiE
VLRAILEATSFVDQLGIGYSHLKVLDINCGLGAFVHYMHDGGFLHIRGTDMSRTVRGQWDKKKLLTVTDPWHLPFEDKSWHIIKWTTTFNSRVPEHRWDEVIEEMRRVGNGAYIFSNIAEDDGDREIWLNRLLDHNIVVFRVDEAANLLFAIEG